MKDGDPGIFMSRIRILDEFPTVCEEIWLPEKLFSRFMDIPLQDVGALFYPLYESQCGQLVVQAEEVLSAAIASDETANLLQIDSGSPIMVVERLAKNYSGEPLEWRQSRGSADQFRYYTEIR